MQRIVEANTVENNYDVIYMNDLILPAQKPSNFTFYKFVNGISGKRGII